MFASIKNLFVKKSVVSVEAVEPEPVFNPKAPISQELREESFRGTLRYVKMSKSQKAAWMKVVGLDENTVREFEPLYGRETWTKAQHNAQRKAVEAFLKA